MILQYHKGTTNYTEIRHANGTVLAAGRDPRFATISLLASIQFKVHNQVAFDAISEAMELIASDKHSIKEVENDEQ